MTEILSKLYLELANIVPEDCISVREKELRYQIDKYGIALLMIANGCTDPRGVARDILDKIKAAEEAGRD